MTRNLYPRRKCNLPACTRKDFHLLGEIDCIANVNLPDQPEEPETHYDGDY